MPTIDTPHGTVHYRVAGPSTSTAPAVVFVHGFLVNGELWSTVAELLATRGIRSYAPDLPLGSHPIALRPDADVSPRGIAGLLNEFMAALELSDVTLVGNDTGGALCQFLIDSDHSRIGRLVLTNCDAFDQFPPSPFGLIVAVGRRPWRLKAMMTSVRPTAVRHSVLGFGALVAKPLDAAMTRRWITPSLTDAGVRRDTARVLSRIDARDLLDVSTRLGDFPKPVVLVWGDADRFFRFSFAERLREVFADARLIRVPGGRTFLPLDEPEQVALAIAG